MTPVRVDHKVLIIAADPLLAALVGSLVELTRLQAAFPRPEERPEDALTRVRPVAAVLVDAVTDEAQSDIFLAKATRRGVPVMMFGSDSVMGARREWARTRSIATFVLPMDIDELSTALGALQPPNVVARRGQRRAAHTERAANGTLVFDDGVTRWQVYDRRSAERRGTVDRRFVSDTGEIRRCDVSPDDADSQSVADLTAQLARATAVVQ